MPERLLCHHAKWFILIITAQLHFPTNARGRPEQAQHYPYGKWKNEPHPALQVCSAPERLAKGLMLLGMAGANRRAAALSGRHLLWCAALSG